MNVSKGSEGATSKKGTVRIEFSNSLRSLSSTHRPAPNRVQVLEKKKKVRLASRLRNLYASHLSYISLVLRTAIVVAKLTREI